MRKRSGGLMTGGRLASVLSLDMAQWWTPSVEDFYGRLLKAGLLQAMTEAKVTADAPFASVKKDEAARMAAKALKIVAGFPSRCGSLLEG